MDPVSIPLNYDACSCRRLIFRHSKPVAKLHVPKDTTDIAPGDIANAILFLVLDEAKMINGACLPVDRAWGVILTLRCHLSTSAGAKNTLSRTLPLKNSMSLV